MRGGSKIGIVAGAVALVASAAVVTPAPAAEDASNLELIAKIDYPEGTHLEFMTRDDLDLNGDGQPETRHFALASSRDIDPAAGGLRIIDITNPAAPVLVKRIPCQQGPNDVAVVHAGSTWYIVLAAQSGGCSVTRPDGTKATGRTLFVTDVTDINNPVYLGWPKLPAPYANKGGHTIVAHPTRPLLFVASQATPDRNPTTEVADLSTWPPTVTAVSLAPTDPIVVPAPNPVVVNTTTGSGPHDITFDPTGTRMYVSSINASSIWDTTDPLNPVGIATIVDPEIKIHHEAVLHPDGRHLLVVDEFVAAPPAGTPGCPGGGVTIFDLGPNRQWEAAPVKVGRFYATDVSVPALEDTHGSVLDPACTAHEFQISPDGRFMPIAWMGAGVRVFDLGQLVAVGDTPVPVPVVVPEIGYYKVPETDVWAAKAHPSAPGYVFVSDTAAKPGATTPADRPGPGFRVLRYTGQSR